MFEYLQHKVEKNGNIILRMAGVWATFGRA